MCQKKSEYDADTAELESAERRLRFDEDAARLMPEQAENQRPRLHDVEAARVAAEAARASTQSNF